MRRVAIGGVALAAALVLVGCTGQDEGPTPTPTVTSSASPTMPDLDQFTPPPSGLVDEDTGETVEPQPVPEWDEASRVAVVDAAEAAMTAFARPDLDYDTWWAGVEPLLTPEAAEDYAYVDPANILRAFSDLAVVAEECPRGCTHLPSAPDCAIIEAVAEGRLGERGAARLDSLQRLLETFSG